MKRKKNNNKIKYIFIIVMFIVLYYIFNNNFILNNLKGLTSNVINTNSNYNNIELEINNELKKEIKELKKINKIDSLLSDSIIINASVIKRSTPFWHNFITINKGEKDGIKKGFGIIDSNGLIGEVIIVNKNTSEVKLITNTDKGIMTAKFSYNNEDYYGNIKRYNIIKNELYLENVIGDFNKKELINNYVVTSGLSSNIPSGIIIGKIIDIKKDKYNLSNVISIKISSNINDINIVKVVGKK